MPTVRDEIKKAGAEFTNFYITEPQCCTSRVSTLLGEYPHVHQVERNREPECGEAKYRSMGHELRDIGTEMQDRGYRTGLIGKYLNGYNKARIPPGWDHWFGKFSSPQPYFDWNTSDQGKVEHFGTRALAYADDVIMKRDKIWTSTATAPFYPYLAPLGPHTPYDDPPGYARLLTHTRPIKTPAYNEHDVSDKSRFVSLRKRIKGLVARIGYTQNDGRATVRRPMSAQDTRQELRDKRQELRGIRDELRAEETTREDKKALRARKKRAREEMRRLKSELGEAGE